MRCVNRAASAARGCTRHSVAASAERESLRDELRVESGALHDLRLATAAHENNAELAAAALFEKTEQAIRTAKLEAEWVEKLQSDIGSVQLEVAKHEATKLVAERWGSMALRVECCEELAAFRWTLDVTRTRDSDVKEQLDVAFTRESDVKEELESRLREMHISLHVSQVQECQLEEQLAECEHNSRGRGEAEQQCKNEKVEVTILRQRAHQVDAEWRERERRLEEEASELRESLKESEAGKLCDEVVSPQMDVVKDALDHASWQLRTERSRLQRLCGTLGCGESPLKLLCDDSSRKLSAVCDAVAREQAAYATSSESLVGRQCLRRSLTAIDTFRVEACGNARTQLLEHDVAACGTPTFGLQKRRPQFPTLLPLCPLPQHALASSAFDVKSKQ